MKFRVNQHVLYPCVHRVQSIEPKAPTTSGKKEKYFLSLNRFESRKNLGLALKAYAANKDFFMKNGVRLIIAGGLDMKSTDSFGTFDKLKV